MSKIPYTINLDRYICTELQDMRDMHKQRDYSGLLASVERVQHHGSAMEDALFQQRRKICKLRAKLKKIKEGEKDDTNK